MATAVILSGSGRYADPWHPFAETSRCLAEILDGCGVSVSIATDVDAAMTRLHGVDLLVVNAGDSSRNDLPAPDLTAARSGFDAALDRGIAVLGTHTAAASLGDYPRWEATLGGRWLPDLSMHPPIGPARVRLHVDRHPIVAGPGAPHFDTYDELYSDLRVAADVVPLATHPLHGVDQPLLWAREHGASRVVYSALGHVARAYDSAELRELLARATGWLLDA